MSGRNDAWRNLLPGVVLIVLGVLFLADKFIDFNFKWYFRTWWPLLLIGLGAVQLVSRPARPVGALVLITIGVIFQVDRLDIFYWWNMRRMWPLILIAVGFGLLLCRLPRRPVDAPPGSVEIKS